MTGPRHGAGGTRGFGAGAMTQARAGSETGPGERAVSPPAAPRPADPAGGPLRRTIRIVNPNGLHHRVADLFAKTAGRFAAAVTVRNGDLAVDGKSLWDLLMLLAFEGTDVVLEVDGPDAAAAVEPLAAILAAPGGEDYTI